MEKILGKVVEKNCEKKILEVKKILRKEILGRKFGKKFWSFRNHFGKKFLEKIGNKIVKKEWKNF